MVSMSSNATTHYDDAGYIILGERDPKFLVELWSLYSVGMLVLFLRFAVRLKTVGFRGLQWDDFFALLVVGWFSVEISTCHIVYHAGTNIEGTALVAPPINRVLSEAELQQIYYGSKQELVAWYAYATLAWCLKGIMVCFFMRMTAGIARKRVVVWLGWVCIVTYVAVFVTLTFGCWPISGNWQIFPDPGRTCTLKIQNFIVMTILNVLTDALILCIPLPMLWTLQVPPRQKLVVAALLSSGVFVISAALIRIAVTLGQAPSSINTNRWGIRETFVGIIAVNIPILRPLFTKRFWIGTTSLSSRSRASKGLTTGGTTTNGMRSQAPHGPYELTSSVDGRTNKHAREGHAVDMTGSEESIIKRTAGNDTNRHHPKPADGTVVVHTLYEVTEGPRSEHTSDWDHIGSHRAMAYGSSSPV